VKQGTLGGTLFWSGKFGTAAVVQPITHTIPGVPHKLHLNTVASYYFVSSGLWQQLFFSLLEIPNHYTSATVDAIAYISYEE